VYPFPEGKVVILFNKKKGGLGKGRDGAVERLIQSISPRDAF